MNEPSNASFLRIWGIWFIALAFSVVLAGFGTKKAAHALRLRDAADQIAQMQRMLDEFKQRNGRWPAVARNEDLLRAFWGEIDADGAPANQGWLLFGARLYFKDARPRGPGATIIDPWGNPYLYRTGWQMDGTPNYVIVSAGPDGRASNPWGWGDDLVGRAPEDADNLYGHGVRPTP